MVLTAAATSASAARGWRDTTSAMKCSADEPGLSWWMSKWYGATLVIQRTAHECVYGLRRETKSVESHSTVSRLSHMTVKGEPRK